MKIKYEFATGEITEVEVSEEIGAVIIASRKDEHAQDERHRYHCYSYDAIEYEGLEYASKENDEPLSIEEKRRIKYAFSKLTQTQQKRMALLAQGVSVRKIAELEQVHHSTIEESLNQARKKFKKFF